MLKSPLGSSILKEPSAVPGSKDGLRNRSWRSHFRHTRIKMTLGEGCLSQVPSGYAIKRQHLPPVLPPRGEASKSWEEAGEWKEKSMIGLGRQSRSGTYITALRNR